MHNIILYDAIFLYFHISSFHSAMWHIIITSGWISLTKMSNHGTTYQYLACEMVLSLDTCLPTMLCSLLHSLFGCPFGKLRYIYIYLYSSWRQKKKPKNEHEQLSITNRIQCTIMHKQKQNYVRHFDLNISRIRYFSGLTWSLSNSIFVIPATLHKLLNSAVSLCKWTSDLNTALDEK